MKKHYIAASLLAADCSQLGNEAKKILDAGVDLLHFDVMDHHFAPNLSFGADMLKALRHCGIQAPIDVHLMMLPVNFAIIETFIQAGASSIIFHPESVNPNQTLDDKNQINALLLKIKQSGIKNGLALSPANPIAEIIEFLPNLDKLLLMSVTPGFAGQVFIPETMAKLKAVQQVLSSFSSIELMIDGGVNLDNVHEISQFNVTTFVVGSALFKSENYAQCVAAFRAQLV